MTEVELGQSLPTLVGMHLNMRVTKSIYVQVSEENLKG